jgi:hypothetical protein
MGKLIFSGSLFSVIFLMVGTYLFPNQPVMWLAGTSLFYTVLRAMMAVTLLAVLFTEPPRKLYIRLIMGLLGAALVGIGLAMSMSETMHILDVLLFLEVGVAFGIEALEFTDEELAENEERWHERYLDQAGPRLGPISRTLLTMASK